MKKHTSELFDHKLKIETERLMLRPFNMGDLEAFSLICADPEVMRYIGNGKALDRAEVEQLLLWIISQYEELGFGLFALTWKENSILLGFCGLIKQIVDNESYIELGYRLDRSFWGKGIASEVAKAIRDYAFYQLEIPCLISIIQVDNIASKRVAQKTGMHHWKQTHFKGNLVDIFYMDSTSKPCKTD